MAELPHRDGGSQGLQLLARSRSTAKGAQVTVVHRSGNALLCASIRSRKGLGLTRPEVSTPSRPTEVPEFAQPERQSMHAPASRALRIGFGFIAFPFMKDKDTDRDAVGACGFFVFGMPLGQIIEVRRWRTPDSVAVSGSVLSTRSRLVSCRWIPVSSDSLMMV